MFKCTCCQELVESLDSFSDLCIECTKCLDAFDRAMLDFPEYSSMGPEWPEQE